MFKLLADSRLISGILWGARIMGASLLIVLIVFAAGEGLPNFSLISIEETFMFLALATMAAGILAAFKWEGPGSILIIDGFLLFLALEYISSGSLNPGFIFFLFPLTGLMFLYYWYQTNKNKTPKTTS